MKLRLLTIVLFGLITGMSGQTKSTGVVTMGSMTAKIDMDSSTSTVTYTLTGPSTKWFALGIHATTMSTNTPIDIISYGTALQDRYLGGGHNAPKTDTQSDLTLVSNTVSGTTRTIVATRPFSTGDSKDYTYAYSLTSLQVIWAVGPSTSVSAEHSSKGAKTMNFSVVAATENVTKLNDITVFPIPANNVINISNKAGILLDGVVIYDINGRAVKQVTLNSATENNDIDVSALQNDTYFMEISGNGEKVVKKIEVKH